ncbi:NAD(P)-binding domain-containing protein [Ferribacterium limneticum]|uniref:NAD(P)-binding domain-containing protein n=1 Tax=Ferribacterium limneticum TaxID=76259 RepID=UPI001CF8E76C|nr:NAD(P)-binding domain-containing protein [Ferribacterium limneticum]UCV21466.1 NAD(P)-binding domain-containing protein [Ferribacterium limneticum]
MISDLIYYLLPALLILIPAAFHLRAKKKVSAIHHAVLKEAQDAGLTEPPSLHPVVDLSICMGSGACVRACPEKALGVIKGKGVLINPTHCIGHGACAPACPVGAIKLVFGTEKRGMDIPQVDPDFQTNIPGIFIAGELGGMGLIRNAIRQGTHAVKAITSRPHGKADYDLLIIGAGPAGIAASLAAKEAGLNYVTVEQEDSLGGTTYHYPRNKLVMTAPMRLPLIGEIKVREISKEELMEIWQGILDKATPNIRFSERMEEITPVNGIFSVRTNKATYSTASVLLAIGRRGTPRKLGAKGEEQAKVVYRLIEADQYRGKHVLVVGGGDSALEAALDIANEPGTHVTLSYRGKAFDRVKPKNRARLAEAIAENRIEQLLESTVREIGVDNIALKHGDDILERPNDAVIVCAGGELPTPMLKKMGVQVDTRYGE